MRNYTALYALGVLTGIEDEHGKEVRYAYRDMVTVELGIEEEDTLREEILRQPLTRALPLAILGGRGDAGQGEMVLCRSFYPEDSLKWERRELEESDPRVAASAQSSEKETIEKGNEHVRQQAESRRA